MNICNKCNGTGNEGFISVIICAQCGGTGINKECSIDDVRVVEKEIREPLAEQIFIQLPVSEEPLLFQKQAVEEKTVLQPLSGGIKVYASVSEDIIVAPFNVAYFKAKKCRLMGIDADNPGCNARFMVGGVSVGYAPQFGKNFASGNVDEMMSDMFYDLTEVDWEWFSTVGLGRECRIHVFNPNSFAIIAKAFVLGVGKNEL